MRSSSLSNTLQQELREFVAQRLGLHFSPERWHDLRRGLQAAVQEIGFSDLNAAALYLLSSSLTRSHLDILASHLTIGETYFFREQKTLEILRQEVLPEIIRSRRLDAKRLRIWSAGCCTGEEPYSLAILLEQVVPDLAKWFVTILATDINTRFLRTAASGVYSQWSFRGTPPDFKNRYFRQTENGRYAILPEIKNRVTFKQLNLVLDAFPSLAAETNAMDLILCRNVLMYFSPRQTLKVIGNLHRALAPGGWLVVSPTEYSQMRFNQFQTVNYPGAILYRKQEDSIQQETLLSFPSWTGPLVSDTTYNPQLPGRDESVAGEVECKEEEFRLPSHAQAEAPREPDTYSDQARALANQGNLPEALALCNSWIETEKLDPEGHYLRGIILEELGDSAEAERSFQTAIYLEPQLTLAHFALGNLTRIQSKNEQSSRHFANALSLLAGHDTEEVLPEADGLTVGRLREMIMSINTMEVVS